MEESVGIGNPGSFRLHFQRSRDVLEALFDIRPVKTQMPEKAKIQPSRNCARCGEPTMPAKMVETADGWFCRGCER